MSNDFYYSLCGYFIIISIPFCFFLLFNRAKNSFSNSTHCYYQTHSAQFNKFQRKPQWVQRETIRIKAHAENSGCRAVADIFNRHYAATGFSVSKSYVATILRNHHSEILNLRKIWKRKTPRRISKNRVWGMDLTGIMNAGHSITNIVGIIDHGTRTCISIKSLQNKASITLLKILIEAMERNGIPEAIRTDNESIFTSRMFRFGLYEPCSIVLGKMVGLKDFLAPSNK